MKEQIVSWSYEIASDNSEVVSYSSSTASMILYVLQKIINVASFSNSQIPKHPIFASLTDDEYSEYLKRWKSEFGHLLIAVENNDLVSSTFGKNNLFTLGWVIGVFSYYTNAKLPPEELQMLSTKLAKVENDALTKLKSYFINPYKIECINEFFGDKIDEKGSAQKTYLEHAFHTLRAIHVIFKLQELSQSRGHNGVIDEETKNNILNEIKPFFIGKIHDHLSFFEIANSNFDPAELVFALEGVLRIDKWLELKSVDYNLINRIFKVIEDSQSKSPYWRPLKPFITTSQGMVLLPLSIEIANSMIRICRMLEEQGKYYFYEYINLFKKYTNWLKSRQAVIQPKGKKQLYGWHSEHVNNPNIIHPWETVQVLHYLIKYSCMLQEHIARQSLRLSNLQIQTKKIKKIYEIEIKKDKKYLYETYWNKKIVLEFDAVRTLDGDLDDMKIYNLIGKKFIRPRVNKLNQTTFFSMLLYGPPGTGKTTIADKIAETLNWPLITITPSDFLSTGPSNVEAKAKNIFKCLMEQEHKVILFDEIDHLIMDRDLPLYSEQDDVFQFMTPSMLVKLKDLRESAKSIFIIATNYEERIDTAIKRIGRIDKKYLVLPPNKMARLEIMKELLRKAHEKKLISGGADEIKQTIESLVFDTLNKFLVTTCLYSFGELRIALEESINDDRDNTMENIIISLNDYKVEPSIGFNAYTERFRTRDLKSDKVERVRQEPLEEFLRLLYLKIETVFDNVEASKKEIKESKNVLLRVLNSIFNETFLVEEGLKERIVETLAVKLNLETNNIIIQSVATFFKNSFSILNTK